MSETQRKPMLLVAERVEPDPPAPPVQPPVQTPPPDAAVSSYRAWRAAAQGTITVLAAVLAVRLILLVAVSGAIVLAWLALKIAEPLHLAALGLYMAGVMVPLVWLAGRR